MADELETPFDDAEGIDMKNLPDRGELLPNQIETHPRFAVRKYDPSDQLEVERIEWLAETIERDGQIDDVVLVPWEDKLVLLTGHRRRRAFALINERRSAQNKPLLKLRYRIDRAGGDLFRKAIISNIQRKDFSPMDLAYLIRQIRQENNWAGFKGAKRVAVYLGVSVATVTQYERFLAIDVEKELQDAVHLGELSAKSAFDLLEVKPEKRTEVLQKAREIQTDKNIDQAIADTSAGRVSNAKAADKLHGKKRVENPSVRQAIRETPDATDLPQPMSRKDILEYFFEMDGPVYGAQDSDVRMFLQAFGAMAAGTGGNNAGKLCTKRFDKMVALSGKGTRKSEEDTTGDGQAVHPVSGTGKAQRRDKGTKKAVKSAKPVKSVKPVKPVVKKTAKAPVKKTTKKGK